MKKLILILFLLTVIIISGCVPQEQPQEEVKKVDFDKSEITDKQEITAPEEPETNIYKVGDILLAGNKKVTIKDIKINSEIEIEFDGLTKYIYGTKQPIRIEDYELIATQIAISYDKPSTVTLELKKIDLNPNEYLLWYKEEINLAKKRITLDDVLTDSHKSILITVSDRSKSDTQRIHEGETKIINRLEITNVKNGHRAVSAEKYAIIRVKEIP